MNRQTVLHYARLVWLCGLILVPSLPAHATHCKLHIFFTNGILTTEEEAERAKESLCSAVLAEKLEEELVCDLTYNYTDGPFEDLLESADQFLTQYGSQFLLWLHGIGLVPDWLLSVQEQLLLAEYQINASELASHVAEYRNALHQEEKVVIVAHSQGNWYANHAYQLLAKAEPASFKDSFAIYAVATPANQVGGPSAVYLTNHRDIIQWVPGALAANWGLLHAATGVTADDVGAITAHHFLNTYLSTEFNVWPQIVHDIIAVSQGLQYPSSDESSALCSPGFGLITMQPPAYHYTALRFTAIIENPQRAILTINCTDDIDNVGTLGCHTLVEVYPYDGWPESVEIHGSVSYLGVPRGKGTVTLVVSDPDGNTETQTFPVVWDCCDDPSGAGTPSFIKAACLKAGEFENHCGTWWQ